MPWPYVIGTEIRDILARDGVSHLQAIAREIRDRIRYPERSAAPITIKRPRRGGRYHGPSRDTVRRYFALARRLGLIEFTGASDPGTFKDGQPNPILADRLYLRLTPGNESSPAWNNLWAASGGGVEVPPVPAAPTPTRRARPRPSARPPAPAPVEDSIAQELAELTSALANKRELIEGLPGTMSVLETELKELLDQARGIVQRAEGDQKEQAREMRDLIASVLDEIPVAALQAQASDREAMIAEIVDVLPKG